jgi:rubrerythrin
MKFLLTALTLVLSVSAFSAEGDMKPTQMDDLIRGEMSAVKVYDQVLEKVKDPKEASRLNAIRKDHVNAVATLKRFASADVKEDTQTVGPWGTFTEAWTGAAKLMGNTAALKALTQGEEHGISEYKEALEDKNVSADVKKMIKSSLLPKTEEHIKSLKTFMM